MENSIRIRLRNCPGKRQIWKLSPAASAGFTLLELMIVVAVLGIIVAISLPSLRNARVTANETSALSALRTLSSVNEQYRTRFQTYANSLANLSNTGYIDSILGAGTKSGYSYSYSGAQHTFNATSEPVTPGQSGDRYFFVDHTGVIRFSTTGSATASSSPVDD